ncbi:MAG: hypothetical protein JKX91_06430 [Rhizobiaceae bacterium]|nr:hypothetical protein [Rhizobiaceae bacterium]
MNQKDADEYSDMMGTSPFVTPEEAKEHYGQAVTPEEKEALWSVEDEKRIDIISQNGPTGDHYPSIEDDIKTQVDEFDRQRKLLEPFIELGEKIIGAGSGDT